MVDEIGQITEDYEAQNHLNSIGLRLVQVALISSLDLFQFRPFFCLGNFKFRPFQVWPFEVWTISSLDHF